MVDGISASILRSSQMVEQCSVLLLMMNEAGRPIARIMDRPQRQVRSKRRGLCALSASIRSSQIHPTTSIPIERYPGEPPSKHRRPFAFATDARRRRYRSLNPY
jgi:hypothetical protein